MGRKLFCNFGAEASAKVWGILHGTGFAMVPAFGLPLGLALLGDKGTTPRPRAVVPGSPSGLAAYRMRRGPSLALQTIGPDHAGGSALGAVTSRRR
jgi:hypothetical protein